MIKKTFGVFLIIIGLIVIFSALYSSFNIFTDKADPPEIFKTPPAQASKSVGSQDVQAQLQNMLQEQLRGMLPADSFVTFLNLASFSAFAGILILGGTQISGLGIKLLN